MTGFASQPQQVGLLEQETTGLRSPSGLAFSPASNAFYVIDASQGGRRPAATEVVTLTPFELIPFTDRSGSTRIAATVRDPINMAFDARYGRLLLLSGDGHLLEVQASPNGDLLPETLVAHEVTGLGLQSPQGMAVDPASGDVFVLDARIGRIVRLQPEADGSFDAATVSEIYPQVGALTRIRGLAFDAASGNLYLGAGLTLYELTTAGTLVGSFDLSGADLANPQGMVVAPSADQTDDPGATSLYVADGGGVTVTTDGGRPPGPTVSTLRTGRILELSLSPPRRRSCPSWRRATSSPRSWRQSTRRNGRRPVPTRQASRSSPGRAGSWSWTERWRRPSEVSPTSTGQTSGRRRSTGASFAARTSRRSTPPSCP